MDKAGDFYLGEVRVLNRAGPYASGLFLIFILLAVIYANSFQGAWIFDDIPNILENEHVHVDQLNFEGLKNAIYNSNDKTNRPLAFLTFGLNYYFGGTNPFGYHLVNLGMHFLTAGFLFLLILKTLQLPVLRETYGRHAYSIALLATVFWAVNPMQVTAVTYIVQRMAAMAGLFYVMSMYFYVLGRTSETAKKQVLFYTVTLFCALLGLASKQNVAMLPVSLFFYDLILIQGVTRSTIKKNFLVAVVPLSIFVLLGLFFTDVSSILSGYTRRPFTLEERLLTQPRILFLYVSQLLYPISSRLTLIHEVHVSTSLFNPITTFLSIMGICTALLFAVLRSPKYSLLCFSILFFVLNHFIEGTFIPLELIYEHRNYIPSFFFFVPVAVIIVWSMHYFYYRRSLQFAIVLAVIFVWIGQGHTVYLRNQGFADPLALWRDNAEKAPGLSRVYINLGNAYFDKRAYERAYESYLKAREADCYHNIANKGALHQNLSRYYFHVERDFEKTLYHAQIALGLYPGNWRGWYYAALGQLGQGMAKEAYGLAAAGCKQWPENEPLQYVKGLSLLKQEAYQECIRVSLDSLGKGLGPGPFNKLLGVVYLYQGQLDAAARLLGSANKDLQKEAEIMFALVDTYQKMGDSESLRWVVKEILCKKGDACWEDYIKNAAEKNALNAYKIYCPDLLPVIHEGVCLMTP